MAAEDNHGTVGAVAVDSSGHVAYATSTGGINAKMPGRMGDSSIVGKLYGQECVIQENKHHCNLYTH